MTIGSKTVPPSLAFGLAALVLAGGALFFGAERWSTARSIAPTEETPEAEGPRVALERASTPSPSASAPAARAEYVGSEACAGCHDAEYAAWRSSDHRHAMEPATAESVLGDFDGASFVYYGRTTRFEKKDGRFLVTTENQQGKLETFTVSYILGRDPLQQYLVAFDDGRIQALPFAWDTRPRERGGQRWFHLSPDRDVTPSDPLFWTRAQQNWNHMCGECHTTNYAKGFSDEEDRFHTTWSELGNGCESCHGAGSAHVQAMGARTPNSAPPGGQLLIDVRSQKGQLEQCGVCHGRRVRLHEGAPREALHDTFAPELLQEGLYFVDGQIQDEVFELGSFLQSKMAAHGVTCTNCHDPHSARLKAEGNALCAQCHEPTRFDRVEHHFHPVGSAGAQCTSCHMPARTYMVVDPRRDHRFFVPRPDLSESLSTPNACTGCHENRDDAWAAQVIRQRATSSGKPPAPAETLGTVLAHARGEQPGAADAVRRLLRQPFLGGIAKATALAALRRDPSPSARALLESRLRSEDPWLRLGAVHGLRDVPLNERAPLLLPHVNDPFRAVRLAVAPLLAGIDVSRLDAATQSAVTRSFSEYEGWAKTNSDRAEVLVDLANFQRARGDQDAARKTFEKALQRDETSLAAHLNFADFFRSIRDEASAERLLRKASALYPDSPDAHFALGLHLVRTQRTALALSELERAAELAPDNSHYAYVYAVALYSTGQLYAAFTLLGRARARFPENAPIRSALEAYCARYGGPKAHEACR